jgi:RNase P subunit RPR2
MCPSRTATSNVTVSSEILKRAHFLVRLAKRTLSISPQLAHYYLERMLNLCAQHGIKIPDWVQVKLCAACGAFVYSSRCDNIITSKLSSDITSTSTTVNLVNGKVRLKRSKKWPRVLNRLLQNESQKHSSGNILQKQPQRIYIRNFLEITCGVCGHKTRLSGFKKNPKEICKQRNINNNNSSNEQINEKSFSKKRKFHLQSKGAMATSQGGRTKKQKTQSTAQQSHQQSQAKKKKMKKKNDTSKTVGRSNATNSKSR